MPKTKITGDMLGVLDEGVTLNESPTPATAAGQGALYVSDGTDGLTQNALVYVDGAGVASEVGAGGGGGGEDLAATLALGATTGGTSLEVTTGDQITGQTAVPIAPAAGSDVLAALSGGGALYASGGYFRVSEYDYASPSTAGTVSVFAAASTASPTRFQSGLYSVDDSGRVSRMDVWQEGQDSTADPYLLVQPEAVDAHLVLSPNGVGAIQAHVTDGTAAGGNARGNYATDLQRERTVADHVAGGSFSTISGGSRNRANGSRSTVCGGLGNTAWGFSSAVLGGSDNISNGPSSITMGRYAVSDRTGQMSHATDRFAVSGDAQYERQVLSVQTPDGAPYELLADGASRTDLDDNSAAMFQIEVVAKEIGSTNAAWWTIECCLLRATGAASVVFVGPINAPKYSTPGAAAAWTVTPIAGTVNGALELIAQSNQPEPVRFVATVRSTKVGA